MCHFVGFVMRQLVFYHKIGQFSGLSLELSDRELSNILGEVLLIILGSPLCSIHFNFSGTSELV